MASEDEDEDIKRAIALSLQDVTSPHEDNISDPSDINKPIHLEDDASNGETTSRHETMQVLSTTHKRRRSSSTISVSSDDTGSKKAKLDTEPGEPSRLQRPDAPPPFPNVRGLLRRTWVFGQPRNYDIKMEEVLRPSELRLAVLSSFQLDVQWILNKVKAETKVVLVMEAKEQETQDQWRKEATAYKNMALCFPPMTGQVKRMHSKLMLLSYEKWMRVVVPTANLMPYDWGESTDPRNSVPGVLENMVFLVDLPRRTDGKTTPRNELTDFGRELLTFCESSTVPRYVLDGLLKFDYSNTKHLQFIHSIGGSTVMGSVETGLLGLSRAVRNLGLAIERSNSLFGQAGDAKKVPDVQVDYATASLGALNYPFISTLYDALLGREVRQSTKGAMSNSISLLKRVFRVFFPTHETVKDSVRGVDSGGTIFFMSRWWNADSFPKEIMRDHVSRRPGILSHSKMILVRHVRPDRKDDTSAVSSAADAAYLYVGSHNLSESAWGKLVMDRATKKLKIQCANWECGIVFRIPGPGQNTGDVDSPLCDGASMDTIPWELPGRTYGSRQPWFCMDNLSPHQVPS